MSYEKSAHLYDLFDQGENIAFFTACASGVDSVLDVGAGTGCIALPLAEQGTQVCCVEPSPAMRATFTRKLALNPKLATKIQLIAGEAGSFLVDQRFPLAILSACFDHFLDEEERLAVLKNIGRHLLPGGALIFDVYTGPASDSSFTAAGEVTVGNRLIRRSASRRLLPAKRIEVTLVYEIYEAGSLVERIEERNIQGRSDRPGLAQTLQRAGFEILQEWGGYDFKPYEEGDPFLITKVVRIKKD